MLLFAITPYLWPCEDRRPESDPGGIFSHYIQRSSEILWLYKNSMGPNYIYSYSKSRSYSRSDFGFTVDFHTIQEEFRYIVVIRKLDGTLLYLQL